MSSVITKHKGLSDRFITPEMNAFTKAVRNLYLYGVDQEELLRTVRTEIRELEEAGIPIASPRSEGAEVSDEQPEVAEGDSDVEEGTDEASE